MPFVRGSLPWALVRGRRASSGGYGEPRQEIKKRAMMALDGCDEECRLDVFSMQLGLRLRRDSV